MGIDAIDGFGLNTNTPTTPNLQSMQDNGIRYMNTWATPQCAPTRAAIMSGKHGIHTGVMSVPGHLEVTHESVFNHIHNNSDTTYATALFGKWHLSSPPEANHPHNHGVDHFEGVLGGAVGDYYSWNKVKNGVTSSVEEYITSHLTDAAIDWVVNQDQPWFLWFSHVAPHSPFHVPPDSLFTINNPTNNRRMYLAAIEAMDHEIGRLLESLDSVTLENTVIIFIGDNGTPGMVLQHYPTGHGKGSMYEGGLRVPMIISGKGVNRMGEEEHGLVQVTDLHATLIELMSGDLPGGIHNSYSLRHSLACEDAIRRDYIYTDYERNGELLWAIKNDTYKLIEGNMGTKEFYRVDTNIEELDNLINNLTPAEEAILAAMEAEAEAIRTGWSCQDGILNGNESFVDDCNNTCTANDELSTDNIGCCDVPAYPSVYHEYIEADKRNIYSNGFPNHDYCYNPNNILEQTYHHFRVDEDPEITPQITSVLRPNNRPARYFGVALNGVILAPAPATPFIFENPNTGEYNWDWVFEPTNNQGMGMGLVRLDCASAHTGPQGYHYHGEMFEYLETTEPGITTASTSSEILQVGWASDGFPIIYKFGPDANGVIRELQPSYELKTGLRPGNGITAPCGAYNGKYTNDYEYVCGSGDLDECNGIAATIELETASGVQTFEYFYVITSSFPQISRCLVGNVSEDFENDAPDVTGVDNDGDGFLSQFECNDNNAQVNPLADEIPYNGLDDDCNSLTLDDDLDQDGFILAEDCDDMNPNINPNAGETVYNGFDDDCNPLTLDDDLDQDGFVLADDCDDNNPNVNPDAIEIVGNGLDDDCDPNTLDGIPDLDNDGYGDNVDCDDTNPNVNPGQQETPYNGIDDDCNALTLDDDLDQDGFVLADDCDDNNANINPDADEVVYNGIDDDCNVLTLDDDLDQDGFFLAEDCDDNNPNINPNMDEIVYNGIDDDCDALTLDDDLDQDGFVLAEDCDDENPNINPNADEIVYNGIDDDCNALTLDDDLDQDGFVLADDCDDENPNINPNADEIVYNGIDDDCNALTLDDDLDQDGFVLAEDCDDENPNINPNADEIVYNGIDDDCNALTLDDDLDLDGFVLAEDCDDENPNINPNADEIVYNGIDDDCNALTLDDDLDQDGFGIAVDCDDENAGINPDAVEIPNNGIDEDCDGMDLISSTLELSGSEINIYPNPTSGFVHIDILGSIDFTTEIFNVEGKRLSGSSNQSTLDLQTYPSGSYFIVISDSKSDERVMTKIVKVD